jgi:Helicase conserved C-terminal domain/Domain of unknown function (DUF2382)
VGENLWSPLDGSDAAAGRPGLALSGETAVGKRKTLVESFQEDETIPFFVLSLKAGGSGLTLTAASHVVHFDRWWNPAVENQATDRAFRIGQKRNVLVHKFVCRGTIEERIDELIESKRRMAEDLLAGGGEINLTELANAELMALVKLDLAAATQEEGRHELLGFPTLCRLPHGARRSGGTTRIRKYVVETEMSEEAVVSKTARITEKIGLRKEASDRVETIKDTVRREEAHGREAPRWEVGTHPHFGRFFRNAPSVARLPFTAGYSSPIARSMAEPSKPNRSPTRTKVRVG